MGINAAHKLADSFDLDVGLFQVNTSDPFPIQDGPVHFQAEHSERGQVSLAAGRSG
jgi:hypothetical protein